MNVITGVKPTGELHIGNYFGAVKPFIDSAIANPDTQYYLMIADLHALTAQRDPLKFHTEVDHLTNALLAIAHDTKNVLVYRQSDILGLGDISWMFANVLPLSLLQRMHAYKRTSSHHMGLLSYPILMASDIQSLFCSRVFVGRDQKQHLELIKVINRKLQQRYNMDCIYPEAVLYKEKHILGTDGKKMSKSYGNTISIFAEKNVIERQVNRTTTTSCPKNSPKDYSNCTLYNLASLMSSTEQLTTIRSLYVNGAGWDEIKDSLCQTILKYFDRLRVRHTEYVNNPSLKSAILSKSAEHINPIVAQYLKQLRRSHGWF